MITILMIIFGIFIAKNNEYSKEKDSAKIEENSKTIGANSKSDSDELDPSIIIDKKVEKNDDVTTGIVYLDKKATDKQANAILDQYVDELKEDHSDKTIHVKVIRNNKQIASKKVPPNKKEDSPKDQEEDEEEFYVKEIQLK